MKRISVIVATYNRPDALRKTLGGLLHQLEPPTDIVVADDGSAEETRRTVQAVARKSPVPLKHVWQPDKGFRLARIRNLAVPSAQGDYIIFLDGDCVPDRYFVQDHARLARPGFFVQGKRILVGARMSPQFDFRSANGSRLNLFFSKEIANAHHLIRLPWMPPLADKKLGGTRGCNLGIFKSDLAAVNGFNEAFQGWGREDSELVVRLYKYGLRRLQHPFAAVCFHLWHPENSRVALNRNDDLLSEAVAATSFYCKYGLVQTGIDEAENDPGRGKP